MENTKSRKNKEEPINEPISINSTEETIKEPKEEPKEEPKKEPKEEPSLESLILNLKIISKLKSGYKLSLKCNEVYIDHSYLQSIYRLFSDNSRESTISFLENLDLNISKKIENLINDKHYNMFLDSKENILLNLSNYLNLSLIGLTNLKNTYTDDEYTISKIEMIVHNFELKIKKIKIVLKIN